MKDLFLKSIFPLIVGFILLFIGYSISVGDNNPIWIWLICGIPFGFPKLRIWMTGFSDDLGFKLVILFLNFALAGLIGGFIYAWFMLKALFFLVCFIYQKVAQKA